MCQWLNQQRKHLIGQGLVLPSAQGKVARANEFLLRGDPIARQCMGGFVMDRFYRGFVGGVLAAIPLNLWSYISFHTLDLAAFQMLDWAGVIIYGRLPQSTLEVVSSLALQLLWSGFRGVVFSYAFSDTHSQGYLGKALIFSLLLSFAESAIAVLYRVPHLSQATVGTVLSGKIGAILWGVLLGYLVRRLDGTETPKEAG